ncbi:NAD(P)-dependent alcohol dehydrogenase [Rhodococcus sp. BP-349]|uniref:NAD(P)-dependent alcohol dehydrogenase n=1 Tax=unclassified Rhodococcus (in: high G+C Gram-positive bacteria) TaxID=192944 RepID=UPI001C9AA927|nr:MULTISPECIES: NAD(P)-dependent alcohol dehydrogenase [unclassified Rhodococcus (in: high G+C Gram-positive bacteria)]MBY6539398.1 NAD(P)-dependent alcohol dehydrogenase [Rhodococcus sp. BP-363]MBY6544274.1 NAD(P)-dependent alcohol dehydrogenase [Rhodococcus sp. BP-369]MBY6563504.1 NAD(P)-dependent alcohol dehydrogenase [Rhodococcus sp. BP-370]MBY6577796.1 NAD(P)-dependent alcohol dehydrogenase [Rhodococcus sp. BP-364]MBY6587097.1 NAD(P)-dependent alcohol dehydrogenase [Rhodococcus sp. BP-35
MRAAVLTEPGHIGTQTRPVPTPNAGDVLVRVASVGVCGSDAHYYREGRIGDFVVESPLVLGHEASGVIVAVGDGVSPRRVGSRVSIEPQRPDPDSRETRSGHYNLCPHMEFYATPPVDGALCEYVTIGSTFAHDVPDSVSDDAAALFEPLSVAIATARKAGITGGSRVLIAGAGPVGVLTAQVARAFGATEIVVSDISADRRANATRYGATRVIDPAAESVHDLDVDAFVDASGAPRAVQDGMRAVRPAGRVVLVGMGGDEYPIPVSVIQNRELWVTGVFRYADTWPTALELVRTGRVELDSMVTGRFDLDHVDDALNHDRTDGSIKAVVTVTPSQETLS